MTRAVLLLERLAALIHQAVRDDAARNGLLPIHLMVLAYLARANVYSDMPIAVAEYFGITRGTVSQTVAVLEDRGLVRRSADARHGKKIHLELTDNGEAVLRASWAARMETVLGEQGDDAPITDSLLSLLRGLQQLNGHQAFGECQQCAHFLREGPRAFRCGLTLEPLAKSQIVKLCREWTTPH